MDHKMSYDVRVYLVDGRLPTEQELGVISRQLYSSAHDRTFVSFYLPGMEPGAGSFASAHHKPTMKVEMYTAFLPDEYAKLLVDE